MIIPTQNHYFIGFRATLSAGNAGKIERAKYIFTPEIKEMSISVSDLLSELFPKLQKLSSKDTTQENKQFYQELKNIFKIHSIGKSPSDNEIILKHFEDGKYISVSKFGPEDNNVLRFIDFSFVRGFNSFVQNKYKSYCWSRGNNGLVKTDLRHTTLPNNKLDFYDEKDTEANAHASEYTLRLRFINEFLTKLKEAIHAHENPDNVQGKMGIPDFQAYFMSTIQCQKRELQQQCLRKTQHTVPSQETNNKLTNGGTAIAQQEPARVATKKQRKRIKSIEKKHTFYTNADMGGLEGKSETIQEIIDLHNLYQKQIFHFKKGDERRGEYMTRMGCSATNVSETIFNDVGENGDTIRIIPKVFKGKEILLFQTLDPTGGVKDSYCILDNKLVKNLINKSSSSPILPNRSEIYFQSQEAIEESGIEKLLDAIHERLSKSDEIYENVIHDSKIKNKFLIPSGPDNIVPKAVIPRRGTAKQVGVVTGENLKIFEDVYSQYKKVYEQLEQIKNFSTRSIVKNSYGLPLEKNHNKTSRVLTFSEIGPNKETISVNATDSSKNTIILVTDKDGKKQYFCLNDKNQLMENPPKLQRLDKQENDADNGVRYYTQEEVNSLDLVKMLTPLRDNLKKYNDYIKERIKSIEKKHTFYTNDNMGSLEGKRETIKKIIDLHNKYQKQIFHFKTGDERRGEYMTRMGCSATNVSETIFNDVGENDDTIRIIPKVFKGKEILLFQTLDTTGGVKDSYCILDNKLVKNLINKSSSSPILPNRSEIYFQSQEAIEESGIEKLLDAIHERLSKSDEIYENVIHDSKIKNKFLIPSGPDNIVPMEVIQLFKDIEKLFKNVYNQLNTIDDVPRRSYIRKAYKNYKTGLNGSSQVLRYKEIGPKKEDLSVNVTIPEGHIEVSVHKDEKGEKQSFVLPAGVEDMIADGTDIPKKKNSNKKARYYTNDKIKSSGLVDILNLIKKELKNHNDLIKAKIDAMNTRLHSLRKNQDVTKK